MRWRATDQEVDQRGLEERLCKKIVMHACKLNKEDVIDRSRWKKLINVEL